MAIAVQLLKLAVILALSAQCAFAQASPPAPDQLAYLSRKAWQQTRRAPIAKHGLDKVLALEDCLKIAKENSGKLLVARDRLKAAKMLYLEKKRALLPPLAVKFNAKEGILPGDSAPQGEFKGLGGQFISDFPIYDGGAKFITLEQARNAYRQAKLSLRQTENELCFITRQTFYQLAQSELLAELQGTTLLKMREIAARAAEMAKSNLIKPTDLSLIRLQLRETENQAKAADDQQLLSQLAMRQVLNVYPEYPLQIKTDLGYIEPPVNLDQCLRVAFQNRPDLLQAYMRGEAARLARDNARAQNDLNVSVNSAVGLRGEAFSSAPEGLQTRIDATVGIKVSVPFGPHTLKVEPNLVKEVPDVGQTTPTVYNEHTGTLELDNNRAGRINLEADIAAAEAHESFEDLQKNATAEIANALLSVEQSRNRIGRAQFEYELAQQRLGAVMAQGKAGGEGVAITDEMAGTMSVSDAAKKMVASRYDLFSQFAYLNRSLGIDGYWDPHSGSASEVLAPLLQSGVRKDIRWYQFWRDPMLEEDAQTLNSAPYEDYLRPKGPKGILFSWEDFVNSKDPYPILHFVPEYPKFVVHGENRARLMWSREAIDLGANAQPISVTVDNPLFPLAGNGPQESLNADPHDNPLSERYLAVDDNYVAIFNRFIGTLQIQVNRDMTVTTSVKNVKVNFSGYKPPREMSLMPLRRLDDTTLDEAFLKVTNLLGVEGLTLRTGRQYLDFDFGFFFNGFEKETSFDMAQVTYTNNPWQFMAFYVHPVMNHLHEHFLLDNLTDTYGNYIRYKSDTWRYTFSVSGQNEDDKFLAPFSFFNQLLWDPAPWLETEAAAVYQLGKLPEEEDQRLSALGLNFVAKVKSSLPLHPQFRMEFILGQGAKESAKKDFASLANDTHYGELVKALLTNVVILHPSISLMTSKNSSLTFSHWYFSQYRSRIAGISDPRLDNGGIRLVTNGIEKDLGHEFDVIHDWALMDNLKSQMYVAWFFPGHAFGRQPTLPFPGSQWDKIPFEYRWQMLFNF